MPETVFYGFSLWNLISGGKFIDRARMTTRLSFWQVQCRGMLSK
jgi:hypothetical protein